MRRHAKGPRFFQSFLSQTRTRYACATIGIGRGQVRFSRGWEKERARLLGEKSDLFLIESATRQVGPIPGSSRDEAGLAIGRAHRTRDTHRSLTSLLKIRQLDRGRISRYREDAKQRSAATEPVVFDARHLSCVTRRALVETARCIYRLVIAAIVTFGDCRYADDNEADTKVEFELY